ncbi:MAG TPA: LCP family protein [Cryptosporangiaceae bacterium]|nr:LCP family protein [Cryptosporangiaceae bacterium]
MSAPAPQPPKPAASGADLSPSPTRPRPPRWARLCTIVGAVLVVLAFGSVGVGWGLSVRYSTKTQDILDGVPKKSDIRGPLNILLLGSDTRAADPSVQSGADGARSDTIMLIHVTRDLQHAYFISIPRDSYVDIPPMEGRWDGGKNKINSAFEFGGAAHMAKTVYGLTKVPLDGAVVLDFNSVRSMVDAVGGVRVCIPYDVESIHTDRVWKKGCSNMGGDAAQDFMRQRKTVPGGDFGRIQNQQLVLKALAAKATSKGMLTNPIAFDKLLRTATDAMTVDENMDVRGLAFALKGLRPDDLSFLTLPFLNDNLLTPAGSAVELDMVKSEELFAAIRNDNVDAWILANPPKVAAK